MPDPFKSPEYIKSRFNLKDAINAFLNEREWLPVQSSNVLAAKYDRQQQILLIRYKDGSDYPYRPVTPLEAESFALSSSKGSWVWDHLRVRKSRTAHQKQYTKL